MTTWIITASQNIDALVSRAPAGDIVIIDLSGQVNAGDRVIRIPHPSRPPEALAPVVAAALEAGQDDLILVRNGPVERVLAGAVAIELNAPVLTAVLDIEADSYTVSRYGGVTIEQVQIDGPVVIIAEGGEAVSAGDAVITEVGTDAAYPASVVSSETQADGGGELDTAERIVAVGRGFKSEEDLGLARELAQRLDATLACSRPIAEGNGWMPHDTYIGITGAHVQPRLYVGVGISGQLQHTVGITGSKTIVAINSDPQAPLFAQCDYGLVGDLYDVLPTLISKLDE